MRDFIISYAKRNTERKTFSVFLVLKSVPAILSLAVIFGGIGISYLVKVRVNEEARGLLAISDEKKVKWLATVAERRIEETETLVKENRFDSASKEKIEKNFGENTKKLEEKLRSIAEKNDSERAEEVSRNIEDALERHEEVLKELSEERSESREEINSVLGNVKSFRESIKQSREGSERKRKRLFDENMLSATSSEATSTDRLR